MANKTIAELSPLTPSSTSLFAMYENGGTGKVSVQQILNTTIPGLGSTNGISVKNAINGLVEDIEDLDYLIQGDDPEETTEEVDFESQDELNPSSSVSVTLLQGTNSWSQRFVKISQMFKNIRYLLNSLNTLIIKVEVPVNSISVPANGMILAAQCDPIIGYTPISARFFGENQYNSTTVVPSNLFYQSSKNRVRFINTSNSAVTVSGIMVFYFVKSQFINLNS